MGTCYGNSATCTSYPLERLFHFPSFADALAFTNRVGGIAEDEGHHPALLTKWGQVTVTWWTQKSWAPSERLHLGGAAKTDALIADSGHGAPDQNSR